MAEPVDTVAVLRAWRAMQRGADYWRLKSAIHCAEAIGHMARYEFVDMARESVLGQLALAMADEIGALESARANAPVVPPAVSPRAEGEVVMVRFPASHVVPEEGA